MCMCVCAFTWCVCVCACGVYVDAVRVRTSGAAFLRFQLPRGATTLGTATIAAVTRTRVSFAAATAPSPETETAKPSPRVSAHVRQRFGILLLLFYYPYIILSSVQQLCWQHSWCDQGAGEASDSAGSELMCVRSGTPRKQWSRVVPVCNVCRLKNENQYCKACEYTPPLLHKAIDAHMRWLTCGTAARLYLNLPNIRMLSVVFIFLLAIEVSKKKNHAISA